jgi:hypothetical protein
MKTYIVQKTTVIAGHAYGAGDVLKPEHESKVPNLLRLGHVAELTEPEQAARLGLADPQLAPAEPKAEEKKVPAKAK